MNVCCVIKMLWAMLEIANPNYGSHWPWGLFKLTKVKIPLPLSLASKCRWCLLNWAPQTTNSKESYAQTRSRNQKEQGTWLLIGENREENNGN